MRTVDITPGSATLYKILYSESEKPNITTPPVSDGVVIDEVKKPTQKELDTISANELNRGDGWNLKTPNGAIQYRYSPFPSLCGMMIIHEVSFGNIKKGCKEKFYEEVQDYLRTGHPFAGQNDRGNLMMSDAVGGEANKQERGKCCIYDMCTYLGWDESKHRYNPRSGNMIAIFTTSRKVTNAYNNHPLELDYTTGDFIV